MGNRLAGRWSFDEDGGDTVVDASRWGNDGTRLGEWQRIHSDEVVGHQGALRLGDGGAVDVGNPPELRLTGSLSLSAWVRAARNLDHDGVELVSKWGGGWSYETSFTGDGTGIQFAVKA